MISTFHKNEFQETITYRKLIVIIEGSQNNPENINNKHFILFFRSLSQTKVSDGNHNDLALIG